MRRKMEEVKLEPQERLAALAAVLAQGILLLRCATPASARPKTEAAAGELAPEDRAARQRGAA